MCACVCRRSGARFKAHPAVIVYAGTASLELELEQREQGPTSPLQRGKMCSLVIVVRPNGADIKRTVK